MTERHGTSLAVLLTRGNRDDITQLLPLLDAIPRAPWPGRPSPGIVPGHCPSRDAAAPDWA
ncbi:hypothetical protein HCJ76_33170 [Streptomyces sp. MC1]|nr:hypothetical protein [Streptomyces sp. MC1]